MGPIDHEQWMPIVEGFKQVYGAQNPIEEAPSSSLEDDKALVEEGTSDSDHSAEIDRAFCEQHMSMSSSATDPIATKQEECNDAACPFNT